MKKTAYIIALFIFFASLAGCTTTGPSNYISSDCTICKSNDTLRRAAYSLAAQLAINARSAPMRGSIVMATFTDLNNFSMTNNFGRLLTDLTAHYLILEGFVIKEKRIANFLKFTPRGEFILSRNPSEVSPKIEATHALVGIYSIANNKIYVEARIVELPSLNVVSTASVEIDIDNNVYKLLWDSTGDSFSIPIK